MSPEMMHLLSCPCNGTRFKQCGQGGITPSRLACHGMYMSMQGRAWLSRRCSDMTWAVLQEVLTRQAPPGVVLMELHSQKLESNGFPGGALTVLQTLYSLGYTEISHSG